MKLGKSLFRLSRSALFAAVAAVAAGASLALAQDPVFYISPGVHVWTLDEETSLESPEWGFSFDLGIDFDRHWSAEFGFQRGDPDDVEAPTEADLAAWQINLRYTLGQAGDRLRPFVSGGFGNLDIDDESDSLFNFGVGLEYELTTRMLVRAGVRSYNYLGRDIGDGDAGFNVGLVYYLAERTPTPAPSEPVAVAPTPQPDGDEDGDGVPDSADDCPNTPTNYAVDANGCPILIEEIARFELQVNFDFDEFTIRENEIAEIGELAEFLNEYEDVVLELEGHTDSIGTELYNLDLSERRANAVRDMLIEDFGIEPGRVTAQGFGEQLPVADNETEEGREANRRVVAVVMETLQRYEER